MPKKIFLLFFLLGLTGSLLFFPDNFFSKERLTSTITVSRAEENQIYPPAPWSLLDKILEDDPVLNAMTLKVGDTEIPYTEERSGRIFKRKDYEKEIALKLLDTSSGQTEIIKITKKGQQLVNPPGYLIEVVTRPSGIAWNAWNTSYKVVEPSHRVVIKNSYPVIKSLKKVTQTVTAKNGDKKKVVKTAPNIVENVVYAPYSDDLKTLAIQLKGRNDLAKIVQTARELLDQRGVYSKAVPDRLITAVLPAEFYLRRPVIEQSDLGEFVLDPEGTVSRFLVILATNEKRAWSETCNKSGACGLYQFTDNGLSGTYRTVVKKYPSAQLNKDFQVGASDQVNSAMAAMLLDDLNLEELVRKYGDKILNDPRLEEYLAASYNGAPRWVYKSLNATLGKNVAEWGRYLKSETKGFMTKLRFLVNNNLP